MMHPNMKQLVAVKTRKDRNFWTRIGVAFENRDGSWNLRFDFIPTDMADTTIQLRDFNPREQQEGAPVAGDEPAAGKGQEEQPPF